MMKSYFEIHSKNIKIFKIGTSRHFIQILFARKIFFEFRLFQYKTIDHFSFSVCICMVTPNYLHYWITFSFFPPDDSRRK